MKLLHLVLPKLLRRNLSSTPKNVIVDQMNEPRPLPMGRKEFDGWADRIISGTLLPCEHLDNPDSGAALFYGAQSYALLVESQKFALANMLMHLGPTESHKPDAFFIHSLRKFAVNQVADTVRKELHEAAKARTAAEEAAKVSRETSQASNEASQK